MIKGAAAGLLLTLAPGPAEPPEPQAKGDFFMKRWK